MATAILSPRDCLPGRFRREAFALRSSSPRVASSRDVVANPNPEANSRRRKRSPVGKGRAAGVSRSQSMVAKLPGSNLVMGQVKILKRGELLDAVGESDDLKKGKGKKVVDLGLGSTERLGPEPETVQKEIRVEEFNNKVVDVMYAGSAFFTSPPPSSLPVPAFLGKGGVVGDATTDLRRLLGLNLV